MKTNAQRRRVERRAWLWCGRYRRRSYHRWVECRVIDVSLRGASIEIPGGVAIGDRVTLELWALGSHGESTRLEALVRNGNLSLDGSCRLGVEFVNTSEAERHRLDAVVQQGFTSSRDAALG
jgi:hypothetical protein